VVKGVVGWEERQQEEEEWPAESSLEGKSDEWRCRHSGAGWHLQTMVSTYTWVIRD
jgi:hypothetical protein